MSSPRTPPPVALAVANQARAAARRYRAEWLVAVNQELVTPLDVVTQAAEDEGRPLRRLSVRQLLAAQPGWGEARVSAAIARLRSVLAEQTRAQGELSVGWLIDNRSNGRRFLGWLDAVHVARDTPPWAGFPFTAQPAAGR